ncbi:MAG: TonB family protein [Syntrophobacteria bacterium]
MERKSRKDLILAGILAVFIHAAFLGWHFPSAWLPHYQSGGPASPHAVKLVARRPAADVRPQRETRAESRPGPPAKPSPKTPEKEEPVPKPTPKTQDRKQALPCAEKEPQPEPAPQPTPQPSDRESLAAEQADSPEEDPSGENGQSSHPEPFESGQMPEKGGPCSSSAQPGQEARERTQGLPRLIEAQPPRYGHRQEPTYPRLAVRRGYEGTALLRVRVLEDGRVGAVEITESSGHRILDQSAREAVKTWQFVPARRGGEKMASWVLVPITFRLR